MFTTGSIASKNEGGGAKDFDQPNVDLLRLFSVEQELLDKRGARDRAAIWLYMVLFILTMLGLICAVLWYFGILQRLSISYQ